MTTILCCQQEVSVSVKAVPCSLGQVSGVSLRLLAVFECF